MEYTARTFTIPDVKGISQKQLALHPGLYEGYVKHVNLLQAQLNALAAAGGEDNTYAYAISELRRRRGFEWNGMRLHEYYFESLEGGPKSLLADSALYKALAKQYGSFSKRLEIFETTSARGPGWALLSYDPTAATFFNVWVADHEVGHLAGLPILLALDHWEHAYLVDYTPASKSTYVSAYLAAQNWTIINKRFETLTA